MEYLLVQDGARYLGDLIWYDIGVGWFPVTAGTRPYDQAYFDRYARQADSDIGRALMRARVRLVDKYYKGVLCDIGIGCGAFIEARGIKTFGYDVCPAGLRWLKQRNLYRDPYGMKFAAMSLWDVLEHIADFPRLLRNVEQWLFISLPIFNGPEHALRSKHFRPDEHIWYFTRHGLNNVMAALGFKLIEYSNMESVLGREDIGSFVYRR